MMMLIMILKTNLFKCDFAFFLRKQIKPNLSLICKLKQQQVTVKL